MQNFNVLSKAPRNAIDPRFKQGHASIQEVFTTQESPLALPAVLEPFQNSYPPRCQRSPWRYRHTARSVPEVRKNQTETSLKGSESARSSKKTQYDSRTMRYTRAVQRGKTYAHG